jgi:hypothetical protein
MKFGLPLQTHKGYNMPFLNFKKIQDGARGGHLGFLKI